MEQNLKFEIYDNFPCNDNFEIVNDMPLEI